MNEIVLENAEPATSSEGSASPVRVTTIVRGHVSRGEKPFVIEHAADLALFLALSCPVRTGSSQSVPDRRYGSKSVTCKDEC